MGYDIWHMWDRRWKNAESNGKRDGTWDFMCIYIYTYTWVIYATMIWIVNVVVMDRACRLRGQDFSCSCRVVWV